MPGLSSVNYLSCLSDFYLPLSEIVPSLHPINMFQALQYKQIDTQTPANNDKAILLATPLVLATAFSLSYPSWKTVFSVGRSSFPNTQPNHCTWPSVLWGHHWLSYCQIQGCIPVLSLWISLKDRTCLMTQCFINSQFSWFTFDCFLIVFLPFSWLSHVFFVFCSELTLFCLFFKWWHSPQCPLRPTAHPVHICSPSSGRFDFLLALLCPAFGYSSWLMAKFTNSSHRPNTKYLCVELQK